ncbi:zinc chelation protein SecC [Pseudoduganella sp. FT26W]|uniref:Zinc chelation protein SecC n=1 Tax=Duganella aquatilis TaxID=2666082 RepID=A0A844D6J6_9BURK|nr:zinc chelation protein SecC [Duganella aquatilis]MRW83746.1 zinc chelation protein SecC [Duganella aquatilis]
MSFPENSQLLTTTPAAITTEIVALCQGISPTTTPEYVEVRVEPAAEVNECFANVARKIDTDGGSIQHGWSIWQFGSWMVEAEFHAVWRNADGKLIDISPKPDGEARILFLPDPRRVYQGAPRDNVRRPLHQNKLIDDYINLAKKFYAMVFADKAGPISADPQKLMLMLECKELLKNMLQCGLSGEDRCGCESGKLYRNCHRKLAQTLRI